ncbi:thioredoxin family protein [Flavobacterium sp. HJJ]|uniref:thioredoxin family protein n=1 Tax=Flavobacterium sp. HJJ TaxID=2783792 RepID=UPI00188B0047|nr:thioredoxin family protein [Flavobacterium sp. HJJ]MBF4471350.1 thioredoxin family protein [Flavobacterium sp. HJJ]
MKFTIQHTFIIALLFFVSVMKAQKTSINFIENDYKLALEQSKTSKKPIFIMVYAAWCSHCSKMKSTVLKEPNVIAFYNSNFINVMMDSETPIGKEFMKKYNIKSFPIFLFLDEKETHLYSTGGEFTTEEFIAEAQKALNPNTQIPTLEKKFNEDISSPENCIMYLSVLRKSIDSDKSDEVTARYLATQSKDQLISPINWKIVAFGVNELNSKGFETIISHQNDFAKAASPKRVEAKILNVVKKTLTQNINYLDSIGYSKNRILAKNINLAKADSLVFKLDLQMYEVTKSWKKYEQTTLESVEKWAWNDYQTINSISKIYIDHITDKEALKKSILWAKRSVEINNSAENTLLLARLYNKINDKKSAIENAQKAKNIIIAMGWDAKDVNQFLKELGTK